MSVTPVQEAIREALLNNTPMTDAETELLNLLTEKDFGLHQMQTYCPDLRALLAPADLELKKIDDVNPELILRVFQGQEDQKLIWRAISLQTLASDTGILQKNAWFFSLGACVCWRLARGTPSVVVI
eukprot:3731606-Amphidinium_carterae.1